MQGETMYCFLFFSKRRVIFNLVQDHNSMLLNKEYKFRYVVPVFILFFKILQYLKIQSINIHHPPKLKRNLNICFLSWWRFTQILSCIQLIIMIKYFQCLLCVRHFSRYWRYDTYHTINYCPWENLCSIDKQYIGRFWWLSTLCKIGHMVILIKCKQHCWRCLNLLLHRYLELWSWKLKFSM